MFPAEHPATRQLLSLIYEVDDIKSTCALLHWDQATYMPAGGAPARGRQIATLSGIAHEKFTSPAIGNLLNQLDSAAQAGDLNPQEVNLARVTRRDYERACRVPAEFEAALAAHCAQAFAVWSQARPTGDFESVRPLLVRTLELSRELSGFFGGEHVADPLIGFSDPDITTAKVREIFAGLRDRLVPLVHSMAGCGSNAAALLQGNFEERAQWDFTRRVVGDIGYDWARGRLDKTQHPFMTKFSLGDVRITDRILGHDITEMLFGGLHEAGHALYEQGIDERYEATPLAQGSSSGVHESQSRLWENLVGRSKTFWDHYYPLLQETFPHFTAHSCQDFVAAINDVRPSLIRTDADELTYNLHVMIRFDLEVEMLEGRLDVADLPEAWAARYQSDLGIHVPDHAHGCLQDVHWFSGTIGGAFQGYTLGNIMSAQFFRAARMDIRDLDEQIAAGQFRDLREWLTRNIYRHGASKSAAELLIDSTGSNLTIEPYMSYLETKYAALS